MTGAVVRRLAAPTGLARSCKCCGPSAGLSLTAAWKCFWMTNVLASLAWARPGRCRDGGVRTLACAGWRQHVGPRVRAVRRATTLVPSKSPTSLSVMPAHLWQAKLLSSRRRASAAWSRAAYTSRFFSSGLFCAGLGRAVLGDASARAAGVGGPLRLRTACSVTRTHGGQGEVVLRPREPPQDVRDGVLGGGPGEEVIDARGVVGGVQRVRLSNVRRGGRLSRRRRFGDGDADALATPTPSPSAKRAAAQQQLSGRSAAPRPAPDRPPHEPHRPRPPRWPRQRRPTTTWPLLSLPLSWRPPLAI